MMCKYEEGGFAWSTKRLDANKNTHTHTDT